MALLETPQIDRIVDSAARSAFAADALLRVSSESAVGSEGDDAISVTIVLADRVNAAEIGDAALDAIVAIQQQLSQAGEQRFPIVRFTKEDEAEADGDA